MKHNISKKSSLPAALAISSVFLILFYSCYDLFPKEEKTLGRIRIHNKEFIEARLIMTGATTKDVIQIVVIRGDTVKKIKAFEGYNWVELDMLSNDSLLIRLSDSESFRNYVDSQYLNYGPLK